MTGRRDDSINFSRDENVNLAIEDALIRKVDVAAGNRSKPIQRITGTDQD